jgi:predicted metal-dependent phosphoesterase TrpH
MLLDLHIHTWFSHDCLSSPDALLKAAKKKGLDGVAVTDHDTIRGALETRARNRDAAFQVIVGAEMTTDAGDLIGLFLKQEIHARRVQDVITEIHAQQGLALLPHPFHGRPPREDVVRAVDLLEVFNSRSTPEGNQKAEELAKRHRKLAVCASDAHFLADVGTCRILLEDTDPRTALLRGAKSLQTGYTPRYRMPASQIIKAWKTRKYKRIPINAASMIKRMILG